MQSAKGERAIQFPRPPPVRAAAAKTHAVAFGEEPFLTISSCESSSPINFLAIKCIRIGINFPARNTHCARDSDRPICDAYGANTKCAPRAAPREEYINSSKQNTLSLLRSLTDADILSEDWWSKVRSSAAFGGKKHSMPFSIAGWIKLFTGECYRSECVGVRKLNQELMASRRERR